MARIQRRNDEFQAPSGAERSKVRIWLSEVGDEPSRWQLAESSASDWLGEFRAESELDASGVRQSGPRRLLVVDRPPAFAREIPAPDAPAPPLARTVVPPPPPRPRSSNRTAALILAVAGVVTLTAVAVPQLRQLPGPSETISAAAASVLPSAPAPPPAIPVVTPKAPPAKASPAPDRAPARGARAPVAGNVKPAAPARSAAESTMAPRADGHPSSPTPMPLPTSAPAPPPAAATPPPVRVEATAAPTLPAEPPAAPAPTPVATPATAAAPPAARAAESTAVHAVLRRYREAFGALDADAVAAFWPTVNTRQLRKAFDQLDVQYFDLGVCRIDVTGARAVASCNGNARYVQKVGSKSTRVDARRWTFNLKKVNETWLIESVSSR